MSRFVKRIKPQRTGRSAAQAQLQATQDVEIHGLGVGGDGVGRLADGRVVFVSRALPGDQVRVRLGPVVKQVQHAELVDILRPSAERTESRCKVGACGGCALRGLSKSGQAAVKRQRVVETMRRLAQIDIESVLGPVAQLDDGWRSRHRARLHAVFANRRWKLGYFERHSHSLVPLSSCPVLWSELEQAALNLGSALEGLPDEAGLFEVEIVYSRRDGRAAAKLRAKGSIEPFKAWIAAVSPHLPFGIDVEAGGKSLRHGNLELRYDHRRADQFDLRFEPGVFTQATPSLNDRMVDAVLAWVRPNETERLLELHAGIGNFTVPLLLAGTQLVAVERDKRAAVLCRKNARAAGMQVEVRDVGDADAAAEATGFDTVLLDPPRVGAHAAVQGIAKGSEVRRVVYVSCDAATLARDAGILLDGGFQPTAAQAFDMFPHTPHVETVLVLER